MLQSLKSERCLDVLQIFNRRHHVSAGRHEERKWGVGVVPQWQPAWGRHGSAGAHAKTRRRKGKSRRDWSRSGLQPDAWLPNLLWADHESAHLDTSDHGSDESNESDVSILGAGMGALPLLVTIAIFEVESLAGGFEVCYNGNDAFIGWKFMMSLSWSCRSDAERTT